MSLRRSIGRPPTTSGPCGSACRGSSRASTFYFLPADIVTQILNFGLPAPIDIQIEGADIAGNRRVAEKMLSELRQVPGLVDLRIQQHFDYPKFDVAVDRTKAGQGGFTVRDLANSLLVSFSGSFQTTPTFFLNWQNGVNYNLATQTPQYRIQSLQDIENIPITAAGTGTAPAPASGRHHRHPRRTSGVRRPALTDATITRPEPELSHYNIRRVVDIYGAVQDRDLGAVGRDVDADRGRQHEAAAARQLPHRARPGRDHANGLRRADRRPRASRSCSSTC